MMRIALLAGSSWASFSALAPPKLVPIGPAEVVWNQTSDACPGLNQFGHIGEQPDSMPEAWHNPLTGETSLIASTDWGTFATKGPSLNELSHHDCSHRIYKSFNSSKPSDLASHQWLQSSYVFPDGTGSALIHSEFHGGMTGDTALCTAQHNQGNCQYWSTGLVVTSDGGEHWTLARDPPHHYTFAPARVFHKDSELTGFGALGGLVFNEDDGYYYGHVNQIRVDPGFSSTSNGVCPFRTRDIFDPSAFRGWNGSAWTTTWVDPYTAAPVDLVSGDHTCEVMKTGFTGTAHPNMRRFAGDWRPSGWPSHVMLGWPEAGHSSKLAYAFPAWQPGDVDSFASWDEPQYVDVREWLDPAIFGAYPVMYPALLDADSPFKLGQGSAAGLSYTLVGNESAFVYFIISRKYIARLPVAWVPAGTPDPTPPFPPSPPPSISARLCPQFSVANAGQGDVNGVYVKTEQVVSDSGLPLFQKDSSHHLYKFQSQWKLAHVSVGPVYYTAPASEDVVPSTGWGSGAKPAPTVMCTNPESCGRFRVSGAGQEDVNGVYVRSSVLSNGTPLYQKDASHQLYSFQKTWKLAHHGVGPVYYIAASGAEAAAPVSGWGGGQGSAPVVTCADATAVFV